MIKKVKLLLVSLFSLHLLVWLVELMPFNLNTDVKFPIFIYLEIILACVLIGEQIFLFCQEVDRKTREFQEHPWNSLKKYFFEKINSWKEKYRLFKKNKLSRIRVQKIIFCLKQNIINNVLTP
ncbi:MAG: hypothetical protein U9O78_02910, partial [Patescibacteria group bacterium]|nr:hypothetical protein [Patescibacteria group bacterium]